LLILRKHKTIYRLEKWRRFVSPKTLLCFRFNGNRFRSNVSSNKCGRSLINR